MPTEEVEQHNKEDMTQSQSDAATAALRTLHVPVSTRIVVDRTEPKSPAAAALKAGDLITTVDGHGVGSLSDVRARISARHPGDTVHIGFTRGGKRTDVSLRTIAAPDEPTRPVIGVVLRERHVFPFTVKVNVSDVGGPSAGLMLALAIYDRLTPGSLTGGRHIAGTGAIDSNGNVGPIGGVQQKIIAARAAKAQYFFTPRGDCKQVLAVRPKGIDVVEVTSLRDALADLETLRRGAPLTVNHCSD
ncbi:MAG: PDZ domain-containing protein [Frankia sp.]|nr:PDZ domain-containing protein [Frankia sp.]